MIKHSLPQDLLDLLVDGPSSFAALYGTLVHACGYPSDLDIALVAESLFQMETQGWIQVLQMGDDGDLAPVTEEARIVDLAAYRAWLPAAKFEELSVDEIGLWLAITREGRVEWRSQSPQEYDGSSNWMIDDLREDHTLIVKAETLDLAEQKLNWWLSQNRELHLLEESRKLEHVAQFQLRDGTVVRDGVKLIYHYISSTTGASKAS